MERYISRSHAPAWECIFDFWNSVCIPIEYDGNEVKGGFQGALK